MIPPQVWTILLQSAAPLAIDLVGDIVTMIKKEASGTPLTPDDWNALTVKWGQKTAEQYLDEAVANSGAKP